MSQVRNLRAMFENKGDKSPPDRGRSPGVSTSSANAVGASGSGSPRPLSKVRTNFVAIEKDGRIGLRRDDSGESSQSRRRVSIDTDAESMEKPDMASSDDVSKPMRRLFVKEPAGEPVLVEPISDPVGDPVGDPASETASDPLSGPVSERPRPSSNASTVRKTAGTVGGTPNTSPGKRATQEPKSAVVDPSSTSKAKAAMRTRTPVKERESNKPRANESVTPSRPSGTAAKKSSAAMQAPPRSQTKTAASRPPNVKSSTETSPRDNKAAKKQAEKPDTRRGGIAAETRITATGPRPKPSASTTTQRIQTPKESGHKDADSQKPKPKPKSTTRPVNMPSSLTAPTASSVSRGGVMRQSLSRQSGSVQTSNATTHATNRPIPSSVSASAHVGSRPKSSIGRPKPSVGLPPSKSVEADVGATKRSSHVDEGFLARMMRPTQASSSKTADRAPVTPPKKAAPRPSTAAAERIPRAAANIRRPAHAKEQASKGHKSVSPQPADPGRALADVHRAPTRSDLTRPESGDSQDGGEIPSLQVPESKEPQMLGDNLHVESDDDEIATIQAPDPGRQTPVNTHCVESGRHEAGSPLASSSPGPEDLPVESSENQTESPFGGPSSEAIELQHTTNLSDPITDPAAASESACVETAEEVLDVAREADLVQPPASHVSVEARPCVSPVHDPVPELIGPLATDKQPDGAITHGKQSATEQPVVPMSDSSEPSTPTADMVNEGKTDPKELVAESVDNASETKLLGSASHEKFQATALHGPSLDAESQWEPQVSGPGHSAMTAETEQVPQ